MRRKRTVRILMRPVFVFLFLCSLIAVLLARLAYLQTGAQTAILSGADEKRIGIGVSRGYIYDRNMVPLVNTETRVVSAVLLNEQTLQLFAGLSALKDASGACVTFASETPIKETPFSTNVPVTERYGKELLCTHLIGYTDAAGRGVCGIEKSYDKILNAAAGRIGVKYTANAMGQPIAGEGLRIENDGYNDPAGVVLTVDSRIQRAVEAALANSNIERGAAVVLEADTAQILAMASVPAYDVHDLSASLKDERLPFLNRALAAYPVGSVFKPFVAAAALESGVALPDAYECVGFTDVGELRFRCYRSTAHGSLDLSAAISKSCNCYFIDLGLITGAENVSDTAAQCGFGREIKLTGELIGAAGNVPAAEDLSEGELANLCFGQGALLASPLQLAAAFNTLASGGVYREPTLMRSLVDENKTEYARYKNETEYQALKRNTCDIVNDCLLRNMLEGTGKNGASELFFSCGKTATAQTGRYDENGKESLCTWFCGFFPYEEPKYTVVVFNEDGTSAAEDCAPVFRTISEEIFRQVGW